MCSVFAIPAALAVLGLCGCASKETAVPLPPATREAQDVTMHAQESFEAGDFATAQKLYLRAVQIHRSVDNAEGVARNLVNLAIVQERAAERAAAKESLSALDRFITLRRQALPGAKESAELAKILTEAKLLRSRLLVSGGRLTEAEAALGEAAAGMEAHRAANARARLRLAQGRPEEALAEAERGWVGAGRAKDDAARAEAARQAARATEKLGRYEDALVWHERALDIERFIGSPSQVADSWQGVARSARALGRHDQARAAAQRAQEVTRAARSASEEEASDAAPPPPPQPEERKKDAP